MAVSGGVDSVVLLDVLYKQSRKNSKKIKLIVAHFDHGIRPDSSQDRRLVQRLAAQYNLPFVYGQATLGPNASEAAARLARYEFLEKTRQSCGAIGIITAHHEDDALETAVHNMVRGTGRRGVTALKSTSDLYRPLLRISKKQLQDYAARNSLTWREDSTNLDTKYLRNYIRHKLLAKFSPGQRAQLAILLEDMRSINDELDNYISGLLHVQPHRDKLDRAWFISLPHDIAKEIVHAWLRAHDVQNLDRKTIERLVIAMKTGKKTQQFPINKQWVLSIQESTLALTRPERYKMTKSTV